MTWIADIPGWRLLVPSYTGLCLWHLWTAEWAYGDTPSAWDALLLRVLAGQGRLTTLWLALTLWVVVLTSLRSREPIVAVRYGTRLRAVSASAHQALAPAVLLLAIWWLAAVSVAAGLNWSSEAADWAEERVGLDLLGITSPMWLLAVQLVAYLLGLYLLSWTLTMVSHLWGGLAAWGTALAIFGLILFTAQAGVTVPPWLRLHLTLSEGLFLGLVGGGAATYTTTYVALLVLVVGSLALADLRARRDRRC